MLVFFLQKLYMCR